MTAEGRIDGNLNLSRAFGDFHYKQNKQLRASEQKITCEPDIREVRLTSHDDFFIMACDGIWEIMSSQEVIDFCRHRLYADKEHTARSDMPLSQICEELCDHVISNDPDETECYGCDNMSVVLVVLHSTRRRHDTTKGSPGGVESYLLRPRKITKKSPQRP